MNITLQYDGVLLSNQQGTSRLDIKRAIRLAVSPSLRQLWEQNRQLRWLRAHEGNLARLRKASFKGNRLVVDRLTGGMDGPMVWSPFPYVRIRDLTYVMLVNQLNGWICDLNVKLLVPDREEGSRGDVDNRLKTLLDGLCPPHAANQEGTGGTAPDDGLVFCLSEDDSEHFIRNRRVEVESLLTSIPSTIASEDRVNYVSAHVGVSLADADGGPIRVACAP